MALSDDKLWDLWNAQGTDNMSKEEAFVFARAIEAEVRRLHAENADRAARAPAESVQEDAALWHWLAEYLVGPRTDLDDELVACETVDDMRKLVKAAIKQGEKQ